MRGFSRPDATISLTTLKKSIFKLVEFVESRSQLCCLLQDMQSYTIHGALTVLIFSVYRRSACKRCTTMRMELRLAKKSRPLLFFILSKWPNIRYTGRKNGKHWMKKIIPNHMRKLMYANLKICSISLVPMLMNLQFSRFLITVRSTKLLQV